MLNFDHAIRRPYTFGPFFYDMLVKYFPDHRSAQKVFDIPRLAKDLDFAPETIYLCIRDNTLQTAVALKLLELSHEKHPEKPLMWEDLLPYVLPDYSKFSAFKGVSRRR